MKKFKEIVDITGKTVYRKDCILYRKNYYKIDHPDVHFVKGLNKYLHILKILNNRNIRFGILDYDNNNNTFQLGYFLFDPCQTEIVHFFITKDIKFYLKKSEYNLTQSNIHIYDVTKILYDSNFIFNKQSAKFSYLGNIADREELEEDIKNNFKIATATNRSYNIEDNHDYKESLLLFKNSNIEIEKNTKRYRRYLKDYTFGIELETSQGCVYPHSLKKYGFSICRDGSIDNDEIVSIPMSGLKGIEAIKKFINLNASNVKTDINCSLHVHIGNIRTDKVFINALYNFLYYFQDDYFRYFPYYKKENVLEKRKHYTKALPCLCTNISRNCNKEKFDNYINYNNKNIFLFLTDGINPDSIFNKKTKKHPFKNKWDRLNRYYVFNFMNLLFSERGTIEFRIHENTFNSYRVINQILLSIAIFEYVKDHISECLEGNFVTVNNVINYYFKDELKEELLSYYQSRKNLFATDKFGKFEPYTNNHYDNT